MFIVYIILHHYRTWQNMLQKILYIKNALSVQWNSQLSAVLPGEGFQIRFFSRLSPHPPIFPLPTWQWAVFLIMRWEFYCSCLWPGTSLQEGACLQCSTDWQRAPSFDTLHSQPLISCRPRVVEDLQIVVYIDFTLFK